MLYRAIVFGGFLTGLLACGTPHVTSAPAPASLPEYKSAFIERVKLTDSEPNAQTNEPLQQKLHEWQAEARQQLESALRERGYQVLSEKPADPHGVVVLALDVDVRYGNRALRWAVGFGAGKGQVASTLVGTDAGTGAERLRSSVASDLDMGGAGGDMGKVVRENVAKVAAELPHAG